MAGATKTAASGEDAGSKLSAAIGEAAVAAFVAFLLFVAIIGIKLENAPEGLIYYTRFAWAIGLSLAVGGVRLTMDLLLWRRPWSRAAPTQAARAALSAGNLPLVALGAVYFLGAMLFVVPDLRMNAAKAAGAVFSAQSWQSHTQTAVELIALLLMAIFVVMTAMALVMAFKRGVREYLPQYAPAPDDAVQQGPVAEFSQQLKPAMLAVAVFLPILVAGPQQVYAVDTAILILIYIILGWGLNIVVGLAGLLDLGYVAFYAIGAYTYVLLSSAFGLSFWICLPIAGVLAAMWGVILGFPVLRLRGDYLAIVTLAFGEIIRVIAENWGSLTNGPRGMAPGVKITFFGLSFNKAGPGTFHEFFGLEYNSAYRVIFLYYVAFAMVLIVHFVTSRLRALPIGRAWEALREDEIACRSLGINTVTTKLTAFAMGALFGGIAGPFFAARQQFITPEAFRFDESALVLAVVVLGGMGSQLGIVIAAAVLVGSSEFFRDLEEYRMLIFGASMVAIMVWKPRGLVSTRTPTVALKEARAISGTLVKEGAG